MIQGSRLRLVPRLCVGLVLSSLVLVGCSREGTDWRSTQAADTVAAYEQFLKQYPGSTHATDATTRVAQLAEDEAWQQATGQDSLQAYQQFVGRYPEGKWAQEARVRIENFALVTPATDTPATVMATMSGPPAPAPAPQSAPAEKPAPVAKVVPEVKAPPAVAVAAPAPVAASAKRPDGFGAQLGAFSTQAKAEAQWQIVQAHNAAQLGAAKHRIVEGQSSGGKVYRLQLPQDSEAKARDLCAAIKAKGQACVVYHP